MSSILYSKRRLTKVVFPSYRDSHDFREDSSRLVSYSRRERILTSRVEPRFLKIARLRAVKRSLFSAAIRERASTSAYADPRSRYRARTRGRTASPSRWEIDLSGRKPKNRGRRIHAPGIASGSLVKNVVGEPPGNAR